MREQKSIKINKNMLKSLLIYFVRVISTRVLNVKTWTSVVGLRKERRLLLPRLLRLRAHLLRRTLLWGTPRPGGLPSPRRGTGTGRFRGCRVRRWGVVMDTLLRLGWDTVASSLGTGLP